MWVVTEREAAAMYARACLSWYGHQRANSVARSMVRKLIMAGDLKGLKAWRLVSEELVSDELSPSVEFAGSSVDLERSPGLPGL